MYLVKGEPEDGGVCGVPTEGGWFSLLTMVPVLLDPTLVGVPLVATGSSSISTQRKTKCSINAK